MLAGSAQEAMLAELDAVFLAFAKTIQAQTMSLQSSAAQSCDTAKT